MATDVCYRENGKAKTVVLYLHGFNGFKDWGHFDLIAQEFAAEDYFFCKFNFSHNGTSPASPCEFVDLEAYGENNYSKECEDVGHLIAWIKNPGNPFHAELNPDRMVLLGHSRGGGIAILRAAVHQEVGGLITWASVAECKTPWANWSADKMCAWRETGVQYYRNQRTAQDLPLKYQLYEDFLKHRDQLDIQKALASLKIPVLLCHGTQDQAVPFSAAQQLQSCLPGAELFSVDSDHVFGRKHPWDSDTLPEATESVVKKCLDFLREHSFGSTKSSVL